MKHDSVLEPLPLSELPGRRSFLDLAGEFASGRRRPSDELAAALERIHRAESIVGAFAATAIVRSMSAAQAADERWSLRRPLSPIDGILIGVKDIIETADMPTGQGSPLWEGTETGRDAASVHALRSAGAIILGKTTTTEFALTEPFHRTRNPYDVNRTPGGSSSGSAAAVASGFVHAALSTQLVGSTIRPASYCGCVGFKPTLGALNRGGSYDYFSQSCLGVIANTLADAWMVASAIASRVGGDPGALPLAGPPLPPQPRTPQSLAILHPTAAWDRVAPRVAAAFFELLDGLSSRGVTIVRSEENECLADLETELAAAAQATQSILNSELRWPLGAYAAEMSSKLSPAMIERLQAANGEPAENYPELIAWRAALRALYDKTIAPFDAVVTLSATGAAPLGHQFTGDPCLNVAASTLGVPCLSLPLLKDQGMPLGLQLIGRSGRDLDLFAVARWIVDISEQRQ